jgi:hypothetical protein
MKKIFPVVVLTLMANLAFAETFTAPMVPRKAPPPKSRRRFLRAKPAE